MDLEPFVRLLVAAALTALIGLDREMRAKPAGLRTNIVVGIATAAFAYAGSTAFDGGDPTRVAAQIVSGIGFLGGGAIFAAGGKPRGLTTAAALWGSAAVGLAAGMGSYPVAVAVVVVTVVALAPLDVLVGRFLAPRSRQDVVVQVIAESITDIVRIRRVVAEHDVRLLRIEARELVGHIVVELQLAGRTTAVNDTLLKLERAEGVEAVVGQSLVEQAD